MISLCRNLKNVCTKMRLNEYSKSEVTGENSDETNKKEDDMTE
jgi:hypothetical protein